jgi:DNA-binding transcriptional regulator YiaG
MAISSEEYIHLTHPVLQYRLKGYFMNQEILDFEYFKTHQLVSVDYITGVIVAKRNKHTYYDIGSANPDGYVRLWCDKSLRMKHRLVFYMAHGILPKAGEEIDHIDKNRSNNCLKNLCIATKRVNNMGSLNRQIKHFTKEQIHSICKLLQDSELSDSSIAETVGVSRATVRDIKCRTSRQTISVNYSWIHRGY